MPARGGFPGVDVSDEDDVQWDACEVDFRELRGVEHEVLGHEFLFGLILLVAQTPFVDP